MRYLSPAVALSSVIVLLALAASTAAPQPHAATSPDTSVTVELDGYPWLYLRDGQHLADGENLVELIAVGDVMLARGIEAATQEGQDPFLFAGPWLRSANLTMGNLESVVAETGTARPGPYRLRAPTGAADALRDAGFDVLSLANNHALDFGPQALSETVSRLNNAGVATVGAGANGDEARKAVVVNAGGLRIAFLAFNAVPDPQDHLSDDTTWTKANWDREQMLSAIAEATGEFQTSEAVDAVVVAAHWGYEYELRPDPSQRNLAQALLESGADVVLGHHPHVVQSTATLNGGFVAYSLGNFVFDQEQGETRQGLALRLFVDAQGLRAVQALPIWAGPQPRLMNPRDAEPLLERLVPTTNSSHSTLSERARIGFSCAALRTEDLSSAAIGCMPIEAQSSSQSGVFRSGAIDLTGDGIPETVELAGENVLIGSTDQVVAKDSRTWRGLTDWRVVDIALGDPNDDGRAELLLALFKPDEAGVIRSHPFVLGFREGAYRITWGGSAVAEPIHEVELGDVDGDGVQELVALEEALASAEVGNAAPPSDLRTVAVWDWHGWGFSLAWRSPPGRYHNLVLTPSERGPAVTINVDVER